MGPETAARAVVSPMETRALPDTPEEDEKEEEEDVARGLM